MRENRQNRRKYKRNIGFAIRSEQRRRRGTSLQRDALRFSECVRFYITDVYMRITENCGTQKGLISIHIKQGNRIGLLTQIDRFVIQYVCFRQLFPPLGYAHLFYITR